MKIEHTKPEARTPREIGKMLTATLTLTACIGMLIGLIAQDWETWEMAKRIGRQDALYQFDAIPLATCARMLRSERELHQGQRNSCAFFIERTLEQSGHEYLVEGKDG